jgi:hypothetical protein
MEIVEDPPVSLEEIEPVKDKKHRKKKEDDDSEKLYEDPKKQQSRKKKNDDVNEESEENKKPQTRKKKDDKDENDITLQNFKKYFNQTRFETNEDIKLPSFEIPRGKLLPQRLPKICTHGDMCNISNCGKLHINKIVNEATDLQSMCLALIYYGAAAERDARYEERASTPK